jgi:type II secretory pathway pseudopilin PulG
MKQFRAGFTIIEVMLFLAVGGMLTAGLLIGTGTAIAGQRYKDAVATFQSDIQQQFEDVVAVQNETDGARREACGTNSRVGASECYLLGKYLTVTSDGRISQYRVVGQLHIGTVTDDYSVLRNYAPVLIEESKQESRMEWGVGLKSQISLLVLRSPDSGRVYAFTDSNIGTKDLRTMIASVNSGRRVACVEPSGWLAPEKIAVSINANAASANAVEVMSNTMLQNAGLTQC